MENTPPNPLATTGGDHSLARSEAHRPDVVARTAPPVDRYLPRSTVEGVFSDGKGLGATRRVRVGLNRAGGAPAIVGLVPPLVSCLMVTANRFNLARASIECYRRQTWRRRQLVIVDTGIDEALGEWVASLKEPSINFKRLPRGNLTLGEIRNLAVSRARGEFVCIWDDDDLHHPVRIEAQMAALYSVQAAACLLGRVMIWWPLRGQLSVSSFRPWEGSLLARREVMPRYDAMNKHEDTPAVEKLLRRQRVVQIGAPELYVYVRHSKNTWDESHFQRLLGKSITRFTPTDYIMMLNKMATAFPVRECLAATNVDQIPQHRIA